MDGGGGGGGNSEEQHKVYPFNAPDDFGLRYNAGLAEMRVRGVTYLSESDAV